MCNKNCLYVSLALLAVGLLLAGSASASLITVPNGDFESPLLNDGTDSHMPATVNDNHWIEYAPAGGFVFYYDTPGTIPTGGEGENLIYVANRAPLDPLLYVSPWATNQLGATLQAGTYTLTAAVGGFPAGGLTSDFIIGLGTTLSGAGYLAHYDGGAFDVPNDGLGNSTGALQDHSVQLVVGADSPYLNQPIMITLAAATDGTTGDAIKWLVFDNVRLDFVASPEPSTLLLMVTGLVGLLAYAWRKRK